MLSDTDINYIRTSTLKASAPSDRSGESGSRDQFRHRHADSDKLVTVIKRHVLIVSATEHGQQAATDTTGKMKQVKLITLILSH
jgi:hypothetical protein